MAPNVVALADEILKRKKLFHNPYLRALSDGSMSKDDFRRTQEQFFFAVTFYSRPMAGLIARIPDPKSRLEVLRNLVEEHGEFKEDAFHHTTFQRFLETLGSDIDKLDAMGLWPQVRAFNAVLTTACILDEIEVGIATMGIIEYAFATISEAIGVAVVKNGWVPKEKLTHYSLHASLDKKHAEDFFVLVEKSLADPKRSYFVRQGLELGAYAFDRLYRDLFDGSRENR
jgi:pyrroloquinoline-quinone synthase